MTESKALTVQEERERFKALLNKTNKARPNKDDLLTLRAMLRDYPGLWRMAGDLTEHAIDLVLENIKGTPAVKESLEAGRLALRDELGYQQGTALERLLIEHVVLCWLRMSCAECRYEHSARTEGRTFAQADYQERTLTVTQGRYLRALETLARVRRLLRLPSLQVNIGVAQQHIVAGTPAASGPGGDRAGRRWGRP